MNRDEFRKLLLEFGTAWGAWEAELAGQDYSIRRAQKYEKAIREAYDKLLEAWDTRAKQTRHKKWSMGGGSMSWSPEVFIGEFRPWPDSVHVVRGRTGEKVRYMPGRTCRNTQSDFDFMCSECGKCVDNGRIMGFKFCPKCGAKVVSEHGA